MKRIYFFGCGNTEKGHFWMTSDDCSFYATSGLHNDLNVPMAFIYAIDASFCPGGNQKQGVYRVTKVGKVMIVSWWDQTGDPRPGSNSNLIGIGYDSAEEMINDAKTIFPITMGRQTKLEPES